MWSYGSPFEYEYEYEYEVYTMHLNILLVSSNPLITIIFNQIIKLVFRAYTQYKYMRNQFTQHHPFQLKISFHLSFALEQITYTQTYTSTLSVNASCACACYSYCGWRDNYNTMRSKNFLHHYHITAYEVSLFSVFGLHNSHFKILLMPKMTISI